MPTAYYQLTICDIHIKWWLQQFIMITSGIKYALQLKRRRRNLTQVLLLMHDNAHIRQVALQWLLPISKFKKHLHEQRLSTNDEQVCNRIGSTEQLETLHLVSTDMVSTNCYKVYVDKRVDYIVHLTRVRWSAWFVSRWQLKTLWTPLIQSMGYYK